MLQVGVVPQQCLTEWLLCMMCVCLGRMHKLCSPVELLLQPLICIVDAQLLKAVLFEALKAIDVQNAERGLCLLLAHGQGCVDAINQPLKHT